MNTKKTADLKREYPIYIRLGFIGALLLNIGMFLLLPNKFYVKPYEVRKVEVTAMEEITLQAEDMTPPPPEAKAAEPIEAESEEEVEAATIAETEFAEVYATPEEKVDIPVVPFWKVEKKPQPVSKVTPTYPQQARSAGWEGQTVVEAIVGINGRVESAKILQSSGYSILDQEALKAAKQWVFTPAEQRGQPVRVPVTIPFNFSLTE
jgi:protein TonB